MDPIILKGRSDKFGNNILLWKTQVKLITNTSQTLFYWQIQDGPKKCFTVQSLLQNLYKENYSAFKTKNNKKEFYVISYDDLVELI